MCPQIKAAYSYIHFSGQASGTVEPCPQMPKMKVTPKAKYPDQTQKFINDIRNALEEFKENVHLPDKEIREDAYRVLVENYRTALTPIWSSAQFTDTEIILKTITDKPMTELTIISKSWHLHQTSARYLKKQGKFRS